MTRHIKNFLSTFIQTQNNWKLKLMQDWHVIVGALHSKVTIEKIYDSTIILGVFDSCWMQELYLLSPILLKSINESLDQPRIKQIRFKQAGRKKKNVKEEPKKIILKKNITFTPVEQRALDMIKDPTLQKVLKSFLIRCYQEKT